MKLLGRKLGCTITAAGLLAVFPATTFAETPQNSINLTVAVLPKIGDVGATALMGEYERLISPRLSVFLRGSLLKYKWDDGTYVEDGKGTGFGPGVRFFPQGGGLKGLYVGGSVGLFKSKWDFIDDKGQSFESRGTGDSTSVQWGGELGYRFNLGSELISLTPALQAGSWIGGSNSCSYTAPPAKVGTSCAKESQLGFYVVGSVSLGIAF